MIGVAVVVVGLGMIVAFGRTPSAAGPYVPAGDGVVVERVPAGGRMAARPDDLPSALALAREYIDEGRRRSDPRYQG